MITSLVMVFSLMNPLQLSENPVVLNVVGWSMRFMNYSKDMAPKPRR
jgi:hypothetical protein